MKKTILSLAVMAMMATSLFTLTACGDDNTPTPGTKPDDSPTLSSVEVIMTAKPTDDMWAYMNMSITTTVENGKTKTFAIDANNLTDTLTVPASALPATVKVEYKCSKKEGATVDPTKDIHYNGVMNFTFNTINSNGTATECKAIGTYKEKSNGTIFGGQFDDFFQRMGTVTVGTHTIRIETDGQPYFQDSTN